MNTNLGSNIRAFRKNKGFTQEELADLLGVTPQAVSKWESEVGLPDVSMIVPLAQVLGVSTDALLGYTMIAENEEVTERILATISGMWDEMDRAGSELRICEYMASETNVNPGNFEIVKEFLKHAALLSMYVDKSVEGRLQDRLDDVRKIYKDAIRKGTYVISHTNDRTLAEKIHHSIAWIYIHEKDFEKAKDHINVLPSFESSRNKENMDMEVAFFEGGFEKMKGVVDKNNTLLFYAVANQLNLVALKYGWFERTEEAIRVCEWCEGILRAFAAREQSIDMNTYLKERARNTFFKVLAYKHNGKDREADEVVEKFRAEVGAGSYSDELKKMAIDTLNNELEYYRGAY
ncbi:MAG: helix-turn-helix transcriptional regulator [Lachnospiraceae bacterium]|nr:helix-turn-helix transcriptional regulator [Lachnospiraceae bacterium]